MKQLLKKYNTLSRNHKIAIAVGLFILGLLILPNTIVYAVGAVASYKLIGNKGLKYVSVSLLAIVTFFSGILWLAGDTSEPTINTDLETTVATTSENDLDEVAELDSSTNTTDTVASDEETSQSQNEIVEENTPTDTKQDEVLEEDSGSQNTSPNTYSVVSVVDGDTVKLSMNGSTETIRLIGIDTPESVHPTEPVECFGIEASNKAEQLLSGKQVQFETDSSQDTRDRYGRLLGYIILPDGRNFNKVMIEDGYAYEYTYNTAYKYQNAFKTAESNAKASGKGLWASGACSDFEEVEEDDSELESTQSQTSNTGDGQWYTSGHHSAKYYYHESCDGWQELSESYLRIYSSETALKAEHSTHTLHPDCDI
jgi:micrococcal nuclease